MICSHLHTIYFSAFLATSGLAYAQALDKPALRNNLDDLENALTYALPSAPYKSQVWNFGEIAEPCKYEAIQKKVDPNTIFTYNVTYNDCAVPYVFCFQSSFPTKFSDAAFAFGKVPPRMRQYVRTISFFTGGGSAFARGPDVVMEGNFPKVGVYIHEITHATEFSDGFSSKALMADQQPWINAYNSDSAVPDTYAKKNQRENLAQHPMFVLYSDNIGEIRDREPNFNRIANQQFIIRVEAQNGKNGGKLFQTKGVGCSFRHPFPRKVSTQGPLKRSIPSYQETANATYATSKKEYKPFGITCIDPNTLRNDVAQQKTECRFG